MGDQSRARLTSFCLWFARHRGSVQQLSLSLGAQHLPDEYNVCLTAGQITAALAACGAAGCPLATLQLEVTNLDLPGSGWVGELRSLRTLAIHRTFDNMELGGGQLPGSADPPGVPLDQRQLRVSGHEPGRTPAAVPHPPAPLRLPSGRAAAAGGCRLAWLASHGRGALLSMAVSFTARHAAGVLMALRV